MISVTGALKMEGVQTLVEMGFPKQKAEYAMKVTNFNGVEPAMEWLLAHVDDDIPEELMNDCECRAEGGEDVSGSAAGQESTSALESPKHNTSDSQTAKSLLCSDCGKLFRTGNEMEYHAAKTGHINFTESTEELKPLTEEERKRQLALIEEKLKEKRMEREERENADALERERNRIRSGKDLTEARRRLEEMEMKKMVEERKREKAEEKAARERVRAQIEADKARRRANHQSNQQSSVECKNVTTVAVTSPSVSSTSPSATTKSSKEYTQTRLQIRLQDGSTLTETFSAKEQLSAVRLFIQMRTESIAPFNLMTTFPRKVFNVEDYEKPLDVLGLVPSAVLIMTKSIM